MARTLDHIVLCVRDLETARRQYGTLGFALTPPARHPFGTMNSLVQLSGSNFLELLAVRDPAEVPPHRPPDHFSFAAFNQAFLERNGEGASMLVLSGNDARADVAQFRSLGLVTYAPFDFGRDAVLPDGGVAQVGFSLAFVTHPQIPDVGCFTCQHRHPPELFWRAAYQQHANTALRIEEIVICASEPASFRDFFERLTGSRAQVRDGRLDVGPSDDRITLLTPEAARHRYPELAAHTAESPRIVACRLSVGGREAVCRTLDRSGIPYRVAAASVVVGSAFADGMCLELGESDQAACAWPAAG